MSGPLFLTLEFARADEPDDPFAFRSGTQDYLLRAEGGEYRGTSLRWDSAFEEALDALRSPERDPALVQWFGEQLRRFLAPAAWQNRSAAVVEALGAGRRVVLTIRSAAAELYALPWELLTVGASGQHLGELDALVLRYEWPGTQTASPPRLPRAEGGRVLFAWSAAGGRVPAAEHQRHISDACAVGFVDFDAERDVLPHASTARLARALEEASDPAVLHILCHGARDGDSFGLAFDAEDGRGVEVVDAGRLRRLIAPHAGSVRLVVLCACDSGNVGALGNPLGSVAQALHRAGIAAVVASRFPLSLAGSALLTEALYDRMLGGPASVETALLKARQRLIKESVSLDWAAVQLYARAADGVDSRPIIVRPYRGLLAFQPRHSRLFFGRDAERAETLADLEALREAGRPRFLVVAGASGTGKSSMVLAGAIPDLLGVAEVGTLREETVQVERIVESLRQLLSVFDPPAVRQSLSLLQNLAPGSRSSVTGWRYGVMRPGRSPLDALEEVLRPLEDLQAPFLLVVDQFEELFTHTGSPAVRLDFVHRLWSLSRTPDSGVHVVLTVRVDFLGQCGELVLDETGVRLDRVAYDEAHRVFVAQMGPTQLRAAIEEPARKVGLELEAGLVDRMLADVEGEPGALPLLSYTLDLLWQAREGRTLTQAAYATLDGVAGALHGKANALFDSLPPEQQRQARRLLVRLVEPDDSARGTRRRSLIEELRPSRAEEAMAFDVALTTLVEARLLFCTLEGEQSTVEMAHEAVIRRWDRLRGWLQEDQEMLAQVRTVERWVMQWQEFEVLLEGAQLGYARQVQTLHGDELSDEALALIEASEADRDARLQRRRRWTIAGLGLVVVTGIVMLALGSWGLVQKGEAEEQALRALGEQRDAQEKTGQARLAGLFAAAREFQERDPVTAALRLIALDELGSGAVPAQPSVGGLAEDEFPVDGLMGLAMNLAQQTVPTRVLAAGMASPRKLRQTYGLPSVAVGADGTVLTAAYGRVNLWPRGEQRRLSLKCRGHTPLRARLHPSGRTVALASQGGLCLLEAGGAEIQSVPLLDSGQPALILPLSGRRLASLSAQGRLHVWQPDGAWTARDLQPGLSTQVHPNGEELLAWKPNGAASLITLGDPVEVVGLPSGGLAVTDLRYGARGDAIVGRSSLGALYWADRGRPPERLPFAASVAAAGELVAVLGGGRARVKITGDWWSESPEADALEFSAGPRSRLVVWNADQGVQIFDPHRPDAPIGYEACGGTRLLRWAPTGPELLVADDDPETRLGVACILPGTPASRPIILPERREAPVIDAAFFPGGDRVVTIHLDGYAAVWSTRAGEPMLLPVRSQRPVRFDGRGRLVVHGEDARLYRWDLAGDAPEPSPAIGPVITAHDDRVVLDSEGGPRVRAIDADGPGVPLQRAEAGTPLRFSPGGGYLIADRGLSLRMWSATDGSLLLRLPHVTDARVSPDDRHLALIYDGQAALYRLPDVSQPRLVGPADPVALRFVPRGRGLLVIGESRAAMLTVVPFDPAAASTVLTVETDDLDPEELMFTPDGAWLLAEGEAILWSLAGRRHPALRPPGATEDYLPWNARFTPSGDGLLISSETGRLHLWPLPELVHPIELRGHPRPLDYAAFGPRGQLATISDGDDVRLWDLVDGQPPLSLEMTRRPPKEVLFSPDGRWMVSRDHHGEVWLWRTRWPDLLRSLRDRMESCLTEADRVRYLGESAAEAKASADTCRAVERLSTNR